MLYRISQISGLALLFVTVAAGCRPLASQPIAATITGRTMGTTYRVHLAALPEEESPDQLHQRIDAALELVNDQMSTYRPDSEISRFNTSDSTDWFPVSPATARVVAEAQRISAASDGAFDITVLPLVNLWSFGPERRPDQVPSDAKIAERKALVGYENLDVRLDPPALRKNIPNLKVDLAAIAKGYGVDVVAELLETVGIKGYMVEIGGEVRTRGGKTDGSPWRIGIERPLTNQRSIARVLELNTTAMATSGDYRNFFEIEGVRYSHTINPRTGRPVTHNLAAVTILADSCMTADALATTVMVLGPEAGYNWLLDRDRAALLFIKTEDGFNSRATPAFQTKFGNDTASAAKSRPEYMPSGPKPEKT